MFDGMSHHMWGFSLAALVGFALVENTGCDRASEQPAATPPDAAAPGTSDAAGPEPDGSVWPPDAAGPEPDGSVWPPDAAGPEPDGSVWPPDAAGLEPDGSVSPPDAALLPDQGPATTAFVRVPVHGIWPVTRADSSFPVSALALEDVTDRDGRAFIGRLSVLFSGIIPADDVWLVVAENVAIAEDGSLVVETEDLPVPGIRGRLEARVRAPDFLCGTLSADRGPMGLLRTGFGARLEGSRFPPAAGCAGVVCGGARWPQRVCSTTCGTCPAEFYCDPARVHADEPLPPVCWPGDGCPDRPAACPAGSSCGVVELATICQAGGEAMVGEPCVVAVHGAGTPCAAGLICHEGRCFEPCDDAGGCGEFAVCGRATLDAWGFGICVAECDVVTGDGCEVGQVCRPEMHYEVVVGVCRDAGGDALEGAACDPERPECHTPLICDQPTGARAPLCHVPCLLDQPAACGAGEQCNGSGLFRNARWGVCRSLCDPLGANTCPAGEACGTLFIAQGADGAYWGEGTCLPEGDLLGVGRDCDPWPPLDYSPLCGPGLRCTGRPPHAMACYAPP
jgi:hypothetical protein